MTTQVNSPKVIGRSCKFASTHIVNKERMGYAAADDHDDLLVVKEEVFFEDGTSKPNLTLIVRFGLLVRLTVPISQRKNGKS